MITTCQNRISQDHVSQDAPSSNGSTSSASAGSAGSAGSDGCGRDGKGRFARGNAGGPGNPFARQVGKLRKVLLQCVSEEDMANIAGVLVTLAKGGDLQAIKLLFQYTLGKPAEAFNPDRLDVDEAERFEETATMQKGLAQSALAPDPEFALEMVRALRPALAKSSAGQYLNLVEADVAAEREQAEAELKEAIRAEQRRQKARERRAAAKAPSANGVEAGVPSANGGGASAPSVNGHGGNGAACPDDSSNLENGCNQEPQPSTNGVAHAGNGSAPSTDDGHGPDETSGPSTNGKKALAQQLNGLLQMLMGRNGSSQ